MHSTHNNTTKIKYEKKVIILQSDFSRGFYSDIPGFNTFIKCMETNVRSRAHMNR